MSGINFAAVTFKISEIRNDAVNTSSFWLNIVLRILLLLTVLFLLSKPLKAETISLTTDWHDWRGPTRNGIAAPQTEVPTSWSADKNVAWKVKVPGRGHASPIILGQQIFLTTADESAKTQSVISFDRETGKLNWQTTVHQGSLPEAIHSNNTHASPSVVTNGEAIFAVFYNSDQIQVAKLSLDGKLIFSKYIGTFKPSRYQFGYGATPLIYKHMLIVSNEVDNGAITAFDTKSFKRIWQIPINITSYGTPVVANISGTEHLLMSGAKRVASYDPMTGKRRWQIGANWTVACGTMVWDKGVVFASGGYPRKATYAVNADTGKMRWMNPRLKSYEQSMLAHDGTLYVLADTGVLHALDASSGRENWKQRLKGPVSASPVLVNGNLYLANERGDMWVVKANPKKFELVSENKLGDESFASPAIVQNKIYFRVAHFKGSERQEMLYCIE